MDNLTEIATIPFDWVHVLQGPITQSHNHMISWNQLFAYTSLLLLSTASLAADTIKLKDGTVLEGKIIKETPDAIQFEYNISKSIKDIKTINRSDIKLIDKEEADEIALEEIKKILPTASLLTADDYDKILAGKPADFMVDFKTSKLKSAVQDVIDQLLAEKAKVEANSIKIEGKWITAEEAQVDPYNLTALILATRMKLSIGDRKYWLALTQFEKLEKEFEFSTAYTESINAVLETLPKYEARLTQYKRNHPLRMTQREKDLKSMEALDRAQTEAAFQAKQKRFEDGRQAAKERKERWTPVSEWNLPSISENLDLIIKEIERLGKLDPVKTRTAAKMLAEAFQDLAENKLSSAQSKLDNAKTNGAGGEVINDLTEKIDAGRKAARAAAAAAAAAAAEAENEKPEAGDNDPKPGKDGRKPSNSKTTRGAASNEEPAASNGADQSDPVSVPQEESGGLSFQLMISLLAGVLIIVTLVAKKFVKSPEKETQE